MKRPAIEVTTTQISGAKMGGRDRKPKFVPSIESLECEGLISLEEVDPSCVLLSSNQKDNKVQNGWTVKGISEPSNENVKESKKQRSSLLLPLLKQKAKKRGKIEEEEGAKKKKQDSGLYSEVDMKHWSSYQLNQINSQGSIHTYTHRSPLSPQPCLTPIPLRPLLPRKFKPYFPSNTLS